MAGRIRFTDDSGSKPRPAVVLSGDQYHRSRSDAVLVALSSNPKGSYFGDCELTDWRVAGLLAPTKAKGLIETVKRTAVKQRLGSLSSNDFDRVKDSVRMILEL